MERPLRPCLERIHALLAPGGVIGAENMVHPVQAREQAARYHQLQSARAETSVRLIKVPELNWIASRIAVVAPNAVQSLHVFHPRQDAMDWLNT